MGLSVSAAAAILFTAFVIIFGVVFEAVDHAQTSYSNALDSSFDRITEQKVTSMDIVTVDGTNDTITILNSGGSVLDPHAIDVMVNGVIVDRNITQMEVDGHIGTGIWAPQEQLVMHLSCHLDNARIKVVAGNGISAYYG